MFSMHKSREMGCIKAHEWCVCCISVCAMLESYSLDKVLTGGGIRGPVEILISIVVNEYKWNSRR